MAVTTGDSIYFTTGTQPESASGESSTQASSVQRAFDKRQRYNYVWANAAARTSQAGMTAGSQGYQVDTQVNYVYDGTTWQTTVVRFFGTQTSTTANAANTNINYTSVEDTANGYSSGIYTVKVPGPYQMNIAMKQSGATSTTLNVRRNGTVIFVTAATGAASFAGLFVCAYFTFAAGDQVAVQPQSAFTSWAETGNNNFFQLIKLT